MAGVEADHTCQVADLQMKVGSTTMEIGVQQLDGADEDCTCEACCNWIVKRLLQMLIDDGDDGAGLQHLCYTCEQSWMAGR